MTLRELLTQANIQTDPADSGPAEVDAQPITGISHDSRRVRPGHLFVALKGQHADGHDHLAEAAAKGAVAALVDHPVDDAPLPLVVVPATRPALADLSCAFYENPSQVMTMVAITGTNGKTTTAYLVESILDAMGHHTALLGTVDTRLDKRHVDAPESVSARTTPEAPDLQALLARMVRDGASAGVMEVSSHALAQDRVRGCSFDVGVFTNLTQDHLDFHGTMDAYFEAKARLFEDMCPSAAVINVDDPWGRMLADRLKKAIRFGLDPAGNPTLRVANLDVGRAGIRMTVHTGKGEIPVESPLIGDYNVYNLLATVGVGVALGMLPDTISQGIANALSVPGRMERIDMGQPFVVVVDYAHTPDALERLLNAVRPLADRGPVRPKLSGRGTLPQGDGPEPGRVITVIGCGGDRDPGKRPMMGEIACRLSDLAIFTADNPRSEDPQTICQAMADGAAQAVGGATYQIVPDREAALRTALYLAHAGDVVVIAGKGHETVQIIGDERVPFDDREVARTLLKEMG